MSPDEEVNSSKPSANQAEELDRTGRLARFISDLEYDDLPAAVSARTTDLILDYAGVSLHSANLPWSTIISEYAQDMGSGKPEATIVGHGRVAAPLAALANGTIAHGIELDDTHDQSCSHPGAVINPAALAIAEAHGKSGKELITAIVCGYEVQARTGAALTGSLLSRGFHPTALAGVFGACTAAAKLLNLDADQLQSAWGLAASMASGVMQFTEDPEGTMVKRLHGGLPSHNGVTAALLASRGFRGPRQALDGRYGVLNVFCPNPESWRLSENLGDAFEISNVSLKFYACCRLFHALIDAIGNCRKEEGFELSEIVGIEARGPHIMSEGHMQYRPKSVMSAQYSLPFTVAATLCLDPRDPRSFNAATMERRDILDVADLVTAKAEPSLEKYFPTSFPGAVSFRLKDDRVVSREVIDSIGTPASPADRHAIQGKFLTLTEGYLEAGAQKAVIETIHGIAEHPNIHVLMKQLAGRS